MKFSIITVCYNSEGTIEECLRSVEDQSYSDIEHIIVDGGSTDRTVDIIRNFSRGKNNIIWKSDEDEGIYDAMNIGIDMSSGDIISILNSDDKLASNEIISRVSRSFLQCRDIDAVLTGIEFVNEGNKRTRRVRANLFNPSRLAYGWMPPHPGMFLRRSVYSQVGKYAIDYRIAADYEFCVRAFLQHAVSFMVIDFISVQMRPGGVSTSGFGSTITITREIVRACRENNIVPNMPLLIFRLPIKWVLSVLRR